MATDAKTQWQRAETAVSERADELRTHTTHRAIRAWAEALDLTDPPGQWVKVKTELRKQLDIDYDQLRERTVLNESAEVKAAAADAPSVTLCVAGDAEVGSYAVCHPINDTESWYGTFHPKDRTYVEGDDLSAETSAALKAVFLAGKLREKIDAPAVALTIFTTHPDLTADDLVAEATRARIAVTVEHTEQNPAVALTRAPGYREWREIRLDSLLATAEA